jgi:hypothetical protein
MSPELISAIKERIALGRTKEEIESEVVATGYSAEQFAQAYEAATGPAPVATNLSPDTSDYAQASTTTLIGIGDLVGKMWDLMLKEWRILGKTVGVSILYTIAIVAAGFGSFFLLGDIVPGFSIFILFYLILFTGYGLLYVLITRALLRRGSSDRYITHLKWIIRQSIALFTLGFTVISVIFTGYLFLIIPGLMLALYLSMTINFAVDERARGLDALVLSTRYVYGRFWPVFARFFVTGLVVGLLSMVLIIVGVVTIVLFPFAFLMATWFSYYGMACAWVLLYESLLQAGPAKPLPVSDKTLRNIYLVAGIIGIFLYLGYSSWLMIDTFSNMSTLFS